MEQNTKKTVFLIDDNPADNFLHRLVLIESGFATEITAIQQAEKGIELLRGSPAGQWPDLIFLDLNMPGMDGWEFARIFAALPDSLKAGTRLILLTGSELDTDRLRAKEMPEICHLMIKPLTPEKLQHLTAIFKDQA